MALCENLKSSVKKIKEVTKTVKNMKSKGIKGVVIEYLCEKQSELRKEATIKEREMRIENLRNRMELIDTDGKVRNEIWQIRKKCMGKKRIKTSSKR